MVKQFLRKVLPSWLLARLRLAKLRRHVARYKARQVRHTYGEVELDIYIADRLGEGWYDRDWPELPEIALLRRHKLKSGAKVFNLGAHQCVFALMLAKEVGPEGLVVAVEPNAHNVVVGEKNRNLNRAEQLRVVRAAIAERSGKVMFSKNLCGAVEELGVSEWGQVEVPAFSIDDLAREHGVPDVLYIDIEGFEIQALRGAREILKHKPDCFVEVHVGVGLERFGGSVEQVVSFFPEEDYEVFAAPDDQSGSSVLGIDREFKKFALEDDLIKSRFFMVAIAR